MRATITFQRIVPTVTNSGMFLYIFAHEKPPAHPSPPAHLNLLSYIPSAVQAHKVAQPLQLLLHQPHKRESLSNKKQNHLKHSLEFSIMTPTVSPALAKFALAATITGVATPELCLAPLASAMVAIARDVAAELADSNTLWQNDETFQEDYWDGIEFELQNWARAVLNQRFPALELQLQGKDNMLMIDLWVLNKELSGRDK